VTLLYVFELGEPDILEGLGGSDSLVGVHYQHVPDEILALY
jgi:hypothetical protein